MFRAPLSANMWVRPSGAGGLVLETHAKRSADSCLSVLGLQACLAAVYDPVLSNEEAGWRRRWGNILAAVKGLQ